jgi:hypothetical protein
MSDVVHCIEQLLCLEAECRPCALMCGEDVQLCMSKFAIQLSLYVFALGVLPGLVPYCLECVSGCSVAPLCIHEKREFMWCA